MANVVVDASVVAKWYIPERNHERARDLRDDYLNGTHDLHAPSLLPFEVVNALKYSGEYEDERLVEASESLAEYGISLVSYRDAGPVARTALNLGITIYDASYLALADSNGWTVYTADQKLITAVADTAYDEIATHIRGYQS